MIGGGKTLEELLAERIAQSVADALGPALEDLAARKSTAHEWLTPEEAREHLGLTSKQWERYSPKLPRRYLSERIVRYPRGELDAALSAATEPETNVVTRNLTRNPAANDGAKGISDGERALRKALERG